MGELIRTDSIQTLFGEAAECRFDGACTPEENVRLDAERLYACAASRQTPPLLRLYTWRPWALSLGMHQSDAIVDAEQCRAHGIAIVRRPTGGGAVLHADELTYAVVVRLRPPLTPRQLYYLIHERIATALQRMTGKPLALTPSQLDFRSPWSHPFAAACFASSARGEIRYSGRKLVGSAQRVLKGVVLQHGSIVLGPAHLLLADLLRFPSEEDRRAFRGYLERQTTTVSEMSSTPVDVVEVATAVWESFCGGAPPFTLP